MQKQNTIPKGPRNVRCVDAVYGASAAGNPMITLQCELTDNGEDTDGTKFRTWIPFTKNNRAKIVELYNRLHIPLSGDTVPVDAECTEANHPNPKDFEGKVFFAQVEGEEMFARHNPKPARKDPATGADLPAQPKGQGDFITDPNTGQKISQGFMAKMQFSDIYHLVDPASLVKQAF